MGLFNILKNIKPVPGAGVATAYGITIPVAKSVVGLAKEGKKLCQFCDAEINLEHKFCPQCGKELGYLKNNGSQDKGE